MHKRCGLRARTFLFGKMRRPITPFIEFAPTLVEGIDSTLGDVDNKSEVYETLQKVRKEYIR